MASETRRGLVVNTICSLSSCLKLKCTEKWGIEGKRNKCVNQRMAQCMGTRDNVKGWIWWADFRWACIGVLSEHRKERHGGNIERKENNRRKRGDAESQSNLWERGGEKGGGFWRIIKNLPFKGYSLLLPSLTSSCVLARTLEGRAINNRKELVRSKNNFHTYVMNVICEHTYLFKKNEKEKVKGTHGIPIS